VRAGLAAAHQSRAQDVTIAADGTPVRRINIKDAEMRYGRAAG
jgi:hypothetical protein